MNVKSRLESLLEHQLAHLAAILIVGLLVYSNTFHVPFQFDESRYLLNNPFLKDLSLSPEFLSQDRYLYGEVVRRYVGYILFAMNYQLHEYAVEGYHVVNLTIHLMSALLVYLLVLRTFQTPVLRVSLVAVRARSVALATALLFVAHPLQTEAVTYIHQRQASLCAFFYLLSLFLYVQWRQLTFDAQQHPASSDRNGRGPVFARPLIWYLGALIALILAMKTKENAFTAPVLIAVYELFFYNGALKRRLVFLVPLMATMLIIPATTLMLIKQNSTGLAQLASYGKSVPAGDYLLTQFRVLMTYVRLLLLPIHQNFEYDYPIYRSLFDPEVLFSLLFHLCALAAAGVLVYRSRRSDKGLRLISFGIVWFYLSLSVESGLVPLASVISEYRLYLPSVGFIIAIITGAIMLLLKIDARWFVPGMVCILVVVLGYGYAAYERNTVWSGAESLWADVVQKSPRLPGPHINLAIAYEQEGRCGDAVHEYELSLAANPRYCQARFNLIVCLYDCGGVGEAVAAYQDAMRRGLSDARERVNSLVALCHQGRANEAFAAFRKESPWCADDPLAGT